MTMTMTRIQLHHQGQFLSLRGYACAAFTLLELLVSITILTLIVVFLGSVLTNTQSTVSRASSQINEYQQGRKALDIMGRTLSHAVMDGSWNYDDASNPTKYVRVSDHHFLLGSAQELLPPNTGTGLGQAVFFQAPLGYAGREVTSGAAASVSSGYEKLRQLINCWGFYIQYGSDLPARPSFLQTGQPLASYPERKRFRLMQYAQPAESSILYQYNFGLNRITSRSAALAWYQGDLTAKSHPIADNVLALIMVPYEFTAGPAAARPVNELQYDSREAQFGMNSTAAASRHHQLPPKVQISIIVTEEKSYSAYVAKQGGEDVAAQKLQSDVFHGRFTRQTSLADDLAAVESALGDLGLHHRVLTTTVSLRAAKWITP